MSYSQDTTNNPEIPYGFCKCGCGQKAPIAKITNNGGRHKQKKGEPLRFCPGHQARGKHNSSYNGGKSVVRGYNVIMRPGTHAGYDYEHVLIAERVLGRALKPNEEVHHHGPKKDQCLVICQDHAYHMMIERRTKAYNSCGHADWYMCWICKQWDDPSNLLHSKHTHHHRECWNRYCYNKRHHIHT